MSKVHECITCEYRFTCEYSLNCKNCGQIVELAVVMDIYDGLRTGCYYCPDCGADYLRHAPLGIGGEL